MSATRRSPADEVLELLRTHGFHQEADDLEAQVVRLGSGSRDIRAEAQRAIQQRCHPRWLGDLFLPGVALNQWWDLLERLGRAAAQGTLP